jgi:hypothetical protein
MNLRWLLNLVLAVLVTAGLAVAPMVTPAVAKQPSAVGMTGMTAMAGDMPCCPDEQKSKGCQDCPLVAMCFLKNAQAGHSVASAMPVRHAIRTSHSVLNDAAADGLSRPPPDHPPRILA